MPASTLNALFPQIRQTLVRTDEAGLTDGQLLEGFVRHRDGAALEALVRRHSPMVWGVCRRVLHHRHDAEDAFQATFLVLMRKAASVRPPEMVANWLYGVARQTALKARVMAAKRHVREKQVTETPEPPGTKDGLWNDLFPVLDQELNHLPDNYRVAIVLCDLEGKTRKEAARQLQLSEGTVASRLARARVLLARRLARHRPIVSAGTLAALLPRAVARVPPAVVLSTLKTASHVAAGQPMTGLISATSAALTEGVLKAMLLAKLKSVLAALAILALSVAGASVCGTRAAEAPKPLGGNEATAGPGVAVIEEFKQYRVDYRFVKVSSDGRDLGDDGTGQVLAEPIMIVREGREGQFHCGGQMRVPGAKDGEIEYLNLGPSVRVKITGSDDGLVRVDSTLETTSVDSPDDKRTEIQSKSVRSIAKVKLGESIKLVLKDDRGDAQYWMRIKVVAEEAVRQRIVPTKKQDARQEPLVPLAIPAPAHPIDPKKAPHPAHLPRW